MTKELSFRQVHLDFHTSEHIENVGINFNPDEFVNTLEKANVNSITCFARCHHGWLYYNSQKFPERLHPNLVNNNILAEQIEACHKKDIRVPIYITVQFDKYSAQRHPEWLAISQDGKIIGTAPYEAGFYNYLCLNTPYLNFLKEQTKEVLENLPVDGFFFDIVQSIDCSCLSCRSEMEKKGIDPTNEKSRKDFYRKNVIEKFKIEMTEFIREFNKDCSIFYNEGHIGTKIRTVKDAYTHFELETLPSGGWGYMHFPVTIRYARHLGLDCLGMTGKFHTSWGDFHSFKNKAALEFECFRMLALNAKCGIGDQLHPDGKLCLNVYNLIGSVYEQIKEKEPWCKKATAVNDIGVLTPEEFLESSVGNLHPAISGITRMLQESGHQFDIIDSHNDLTRYELLILPDNIYVSEYLKNKLEDFLAKNGKLIASFESGLNLEKTGFNLKNLGVEYIGKAPYNPDFILPKGNISKGLPPTEHVVYIRGSEIRANPYTEILADVIQPYFNRNYQHFCSHLHTPSSGKVCYSAIVKNNNTIYFTHPVFSQYDKNAPLWCKRLIINAIELLIPSPVLKHNGPSTILSSVNEQKSCNRWITHFLHYIPERRGKDFDVIEDIIPIHDLRVSLRRDKNFKKAMIVPDLTELELTEKNGRIEFVIPEIKGHTMVSLEY